MRTMRAVVALSWLFALPACGASVTPEDGAGDADAARDVAVANDANVPSDAADSPCGDACAPGQICVVPCCGGGYQQTTVCTPAPPYCTDRPAGCSSEPDASGSWCTVSGCGGVLGAGGGEIDCICV